jgi:hypothetical protein
MLSRYGAPRANKMPRAMDLYGAYSLEHRGVRTPTCSNVRAVFANGVALLYK